MNVGTLPVFELERGHFQFPPADHFGDRVPAGRAAEVELARDSLSAPQAGHLTHTPTSSIASCEPATGVSSQASCQENSSASLTTPASGPNRR